MDVITRKGEGKWTQKRADGDTEITDEENAAKVLLSIIDTMLIAVAIISRVETATSSGSSSSGGLSNVN